VKKLVHLIPLLLTVEIIKTFSAAGSAKEPHHLPWEALQSVVRQWRRGIDTAGLRRQQPRGDQWGVNACVPGCHWGWQMMRCKILLFSDRNKNMRTRLLSLELLWLSFLCFGILYRAMADWWGFFYTGCLVIGQKWVWSEKY